MGSVGRRCSLYCYLIVGHRAPKLNSERTAAAFKDGSPQARAHDGGGVTVTRARQGSDRYGAPAGRRGALMKGSARTRSSNLSMGSAC